LERKCALYAHPRWQSKRTGGLWLKPLAGVHSHGADRLAAT